MKLLVYIVLLLLCLPRSLMAEQVYFFESIHDLPLMPGLTELTEQTVIFDKPDGRIIESLADMDHISSQSVRDYYSGALPQFGWMRIGSGRFARGNEELALEFENIDGQDFLKITVAPK